LGGAATSLGAGIVCCAPSIDPANSAEHAAVDISVETARIEASFKLTSK
jgi:hypothetical protein